MTCGSVDVATLGDDAAGVRIVRTLRAEGVDVGSVHTDPAAPTGLLVRDAAGPRGITVDYHRSGSAGSRLQPDDLDLDVVADARLLFVTGLTCGLSGLLDEVPLESAVIRAHAVARRCVLSAGDVEGLPTRRELESDADGVDR